MKKFDAKSVLVGVALCAVLVVFLGSKSPNPQTDPQGITGGTKVVPKVVTLNDILDKCELIHQRGLINAKKIEEIEGKIDQLTKLFGQKTVPQSAKLDKMEEKLDLLQEMVRNGFNVIDKTLAKKK